MNKILISLLTIALVSVVAVGATRAYFTDTATSTGNTFTSGTLDLKLSDANEGWSDGVTSTWSSPANWAPGQEVKTSIYLRNTGTIPAMAVYANWNNLQGNTEMAKFIEVTWLSDSTGINTNSITPFVTVYDTNGDTKLSLYELVNGLAHYNSAATPDPFQARFFADADEGYHNPVLLAGGEFEIKLGYKFMESAPNTLQGTWASFDLTLQAAQHAFNR